MGALVHGSVQYSSRRFTSLTEDETRDIHDYILNITLAKGSGEYCICMAFLTLRRSAFSQTIAHILAPYAYAHSPLVDRVPALKIPITFVCQYTVSYTGQPSQLINLQMVNTIGWIPWEASKLCKTSAKQVTKMGVCLLFPVLGIKVRIPCKYYFISDQCPQLNQYTLTIQLL